MHFDFWQRWSVGLDSVSFANAWAALGLAYGARRELSVRELKHLPWGEPLRWIFPPKDLLIDGTPEEWAKAWIDAVDGYPVRLRVHGAPADEPIHPWYGMLGKAIPAPESVVLHTLAPRAQLYVDWPLRLAGLSMSVENALEQTVKYWPASNLAEIVRLDRTKSHCDVLVYDGSARALLRDLLERASTIKANLVVLQGGSDGVWGETQALLISVLSQTRASGFVIFRRRLEETQLAMILNRLTEALSHAQRLDLAVQDTLAWAKTSDAVIGLTPALAAFDIRQVAERYSARITALPSGAELDLSEVGQPDEWLARGVEGGGVYGGVTKVTMESPDADARVAADSVAIDLDKMVFEQEGEGGSALVELARALPRAKLPPMAITARANRFLQQRSFVWMDHEFREATKGFIASVPAMVRVRIAAPEKGWDALPTAFPSEKLPPHLERWTLTVWLTEPDHLAAPIQRSIQLPRDGSSTECEFQFRPAEFPVFTGRITVLHRGRVLQTAVLRARVQTVGGSITEDESEAPKLVEPIAVRHRLGNLDDRPRFDLAFVANHDAKGRPLLTAVSSKAAWVKDLSQMPAIASEINKSLSPVAKSVQDYAEGLDGDAGTALLVQLAQHGGALKSFLSLALDDPANNAAAARAEFVQIVSTRADAVVPLEFVYDYTVPEDGARVSPHWRSALEAGECPPACDHTSGKTVCPMGFWGLRKVIERHAVRAGLAKDGNVLYLQSETSRECDTLFLGGAPVLGSSKRVPPASVEELTTLIKTHCGAEPLPAKDWDEWETLVKQHRPSVLLALPHTGGRNTNVTVEIGNGMDVKTVTLRDTHIFPPPVEGCQPPLVAFIGCDTAGTADDYGNHVLFLRDRGAGIVIGTIATVFGEHAAQVAGKLVEGLLPAGNTQRVRLGELIRSIRRKALLDGQLMPLCLVAYGDADWIISAKKVTHA